MSSSIISNFHHRLLPLYAPRAEALLQSVRPDDLNYLDFRYILWWME